MIIEGRVIQGKGIASGKNVDPVTGLTATIAKQFPCFEKEKIPHLSRMYPGTLNVSIDPLEFKIKKPDYEITCEEWSPGVTETFQLVQGVVLFEKRVYPGLIYYPMPSPVKSHDDSKVEIMTEKITNLKYGDIVSFILADGKVSLNNPARPNRQ